MKAGLLTFHFPCNFGAVFQCLALQEALLRFGMDVEVIHYCPRYHTNRYVPFMNPFIYATSQFYAAGKRRSSFRKCFVWILDFLRALHSWCDFKEKRKCYKRFYSFRNANLRLTKKIRTYKSFKKIEDDYDIYICGSDQVWNTELTDFKIDKAYFLDFVKNFEKKYTYAVGVNISDKEIRDDNTIRLLRGFKVISLRESEYFQKIATVIGKEKSIRQDIDPTLLLDVSDYEKYVKAPDFEVATFLLLYIIPDETIDQTIKFAEKYANTHNLHIVNINGSYNLNIKSNGINYFCSPGEFLWFIKNANYIVTNSFHGSAFSILYHKVFSVIPHSKTGYRVTELMEKLNLKNRCITDLNCELENSRDETIDYEKVDILLKNFRKTSYQYLKSIC